MNENSIAAERASATAVPAATLCETAVKPTNPMFQPGLNPVINSRRDFVAFAKANVDAVAASDLIWAADVQALTKRFASTMKASYEESVATFKALRQAGCAAWEAAGCSPHAAAVLVHGGVDEVDQIADLRRGVFERVPDRAPATVAEIGTFMACAAERNRKPA
jgi:hypothetical protein